MSALERIDAACGRVVRDVDASTIAIYRDQCRAEYVIDVRAGRYDQRRGKVHEGMLAYGRENTLVDAAREAVAFCFDVRDCRRAIEALIDP